MFSSSCTFCLVREKKALVSKFHLDKRTLPEKWEECSTWNTETYNLQPAKTSGGTHVLAHTHIM